MGSKPFMIKPQSSATNDQMVSNITTNMDKIGTWFERCKQQPDGRAIVISGGPTADVFLTENNDIREKYDVIFCIKHALPKLKKHGITPDFCVVLDPRSIDNTSTLGFKRKDLYSTASKETTFFVASMTHPSVTDYVLSEGYNVIGWHALTPEMSDVPRDYYNKIFKGPTGLPITGGTSSGTRSIELAFFMGFHSVDLVGFDSSFNMEKPTNIKDAKGKQKYIKITVDEKPYYTTGELIAQVQDFERMLKNPKAASEINILDVGLETSLVNAVAKTVKINTVPTKQWTEYIA
jgi:hypothetical protein